ncbi:MAG: hypothetical protein MUE81_17740 [Thermoflexibacter sp.]|nr:hypothetical protein [Thermoflexibacter sp.]
MRQATRVESLFLLGKNNKSINMRMFNFIFIAVIFLCLQELKAQQVLTWQFPVKRTHAGALIGNGTQGLMVWGSDNTLKITIGRAGFWDHRGGNDFSAKTTYREVKRMLEAKDEPALRAAFAEPQKDANSPRRPYQIGGGRLEIKLPDNFQLVNAKLDLGKAELLVLVRDKNKNTNSNLPINEIIRINQATFDELAWVDLPASLVGKVQLTLIPSWEHASVQKDLASWGVKPPELWEMTSVKGFTQNLPADDPLTIAYLSKSSQILIGSFLGLNGKEKINESFAKNNTKELLTQKLNWWKSYWSEVPQIKLPDPILQEIVDYGLYKQASTMPEHGVACTLQGVFMEEYQLPPWSNDYHFNINVQMIYLPNLATGKANNLNPVWKMIKNWFPQMQKNGKQFFGNEKALMLPHAVDDRCQVVGNFWTGTIDHACTAWMAQLAWQHYRYTMDDKILKEIAMPLLIGAFEGYWAMAEENRYGDGRTVLSLPVSVSPEFKGADMDAWGKNASFQLAAFHLIAQILPQAAKVLNQEIDPRWQKVSESLPPYSTIKGAWNAERWGNNSTFIALWEGTDLEDSHRHHAHLGGIYPFGTIDPQATAHKQIVNSTLNRWVAQGSGAWSGWCVPWASILNARCGRTEAAVSWLYWWRENFVNEGRGTLHNANTTGVSIIGSPTYYKMPSDFKNNEVMQLDAGQGALSAVLELLVQQRQDVVHIVPDVPLAWLNSSFSFENIRAEGGFSISAKIRDGKITEIKIKAPFGGRLKLAHNLGEKYLMGNTEVQGGILERDFKQGEEILLKRL